MKLVGNLPGIGMMPGWKERSGSGVQMTGLVASWRRRRAWRKDRRRLLELDDRLLEDMGLTREEVRRMDFGRRGQQS